MKEHKKSKSTTEQNKINKKRNETCKNKMK